MSRHYLKSAKTSPERKNFVRGSGLLAEINFEMNDILEENRKQLVRLQRAKEQTYQKKEYDINELTRQILISYLPVIEQNGIQLAVNIPEEEWVVCVDKISYERILNNLFDNAIKHVW